MCTFSLKLLFLITGKASACDCTECLSHMTSGIICPAKRVTVGIERALVRLFRYSCSEESLSTGGFSTELLFGRCACVQLDLPFLLNKYSVWKYKHSFGAPIAVSGLAQACKVKPSELRGEGGKFVHFHPPVDLCL